MSIPRQTTSGPRISFPDKEGMTPEQKRVFDSIVNGRRGELVGPLRAALHNPELAEHWSKLGETLRYYTKLPPRSSELAVLVTARRWNSELEWTIHRHAAEAAGLEEEIIEAIRRSEPPQLAAKEDREVYRFSVEMLTLGLVSDAVYAAVLERWGETGAVELTALVGYYSMVALMLNTHRIPLPETRPPDLLRGEPQPEALTVMPQLADARTEGLETTGI